MVVRKEANKRKQDHHRIARKTKRKTPPLPHPKCCTVALMAASRTAVNRSWCSTSVPCVAKMPRTADKRR